jgi:hypothetical protein
VPIAANRTITVLATNDLDCWGPLFTLNGDPAGINARNGDPMRSGFPDQQFVRVKPVAGGSVNSAGPDCGLLLFCAKQFGPRI